MDQWIATLIATLITAGTSIAVAVTIARSTQRAVGPAELAERSLPAPIFRAALLAWLVFLAMGLVSVAALLWISPQLQVPNSATVSVLLLAVAVLLFWIARWANNPLKHHRS